MTKVKSKCETCKTPFVGNPGKRYCSVDCREVKRFTIVCQQCKIEFKSKTAKPITCSSKCAMLLIRSKNRKPKHKLTCQTCSNPFESYKPKTMYCSISCRSRANYLKVREQVVSKLCPCCGGKFSSSKVYCSTDCFRTNKKSPERQAVNNVLSLRWELLARVSPPEFKELMYRIERRLPL